MKWVAICGSWRKINRKLKEDVRQEVRTTFSHGDGIITGGALGVDYIATDEALKLDPIAKRIKIFLPTPLGIYTTHFRKRAKERVISKRQAEDLITQLTKIKKISPLTLIENPGRKVVNEETYYERNSLIVEIADELIAFQVNKSRGTQDTIDRARKKGIPVRVLNYSIK